MKTIRIVAFLLVSSSLVYWSCSSSPGQDDLQISEFEKNVTDIIQPHIDSAQVAGLVVAIVKGDSTYLKASFGYADLEFDVNMPLDASFEIGSVTKQFTSVAILQLAESGKLSLDDDFTKYVDFDTQGRTISIRRLMDHTSGIKSYTALPEFGPMSVHDYPRDTLLRIVEMAGFDFEPGEALIYNNTGYFLLGLIIEKASGMSYDEYIQSEVFALAGMNNSYYCDEQKITKNRAHGYDMSEEGLVRKGYLDHIWPFAAGSLCSTVEDLVKWNRALHGGKMLSPEMYQLLISPETLNDGTKLRYAKGLANYYSDGNQVISHGGGINGFLSSLVYYPDEDLTVVVLANTAGPVNPGSLSDEIIDLLIDGQEMTGIEYSGDLSAYTGEFKGRGRGQDLTFSFDQIDSHLILSRGENLDTLSYIGDNTWFNENQQFIFKGENGTFNQLRMDGIGSHYVLERTDR